jgi:hypothetical protein
MPRVASIPATAYRFALLSLALMLLIAPSRATAADESQKPASPEQDRATPAAPDEDEKLQDLDDTWTVTPDPADHYWNIASYLKGTPTEVRAILDKQVIEFDDKLVTVLADIRQNERDAQSQADEALNILRATPAYKSLQAQADAAKAELETARTSGTSLENRMAASSKFNHLKAQLDKLDRQAVAKTSVASLKAAREKLEARADTLYTNRGQAFVWRQKLINAILVGQTLRGELVPGKSVGLIKGAKVERVMEDRSVLARFTLILSHKIVGEREGVKQIQGRATDVRLLLRGLDDLHRLVPKQELTAWQTFKVTGVKDIDGERAYVLEPYACDFNYLVGVLVKPLKFKAPPRAIMVGPATTKPAGAAEK